MFKEWLTTFIEEKGWKDEEIIVQQEDFTHTVSMDMFVEYMDSLGEENAKNIKAKVIHLDFHNADVLDFFHQLMKGYFIAVEMILDNTTEEKQGEMILECLTCNQQHISNENLWDVYAIQCPKCKVWEEGCNNRNIHLFKVIEFLR
ncbi:hypothetical protein ACFSCX_05845 [Bacillus salitolerans]|uniref:Uncharacterized protein n=1 Tax=Bacillus salitolerans TaxID=1437434 RepID=A0ABW4LM12_9BACI